MPFSPASLAAYSRLVLGCEQPAIQSLSACVSSLLATSEAAPPAAHPPLAPATLHDLNTRVSSLVSAAVAAATETCPLTQPPRPHRRDSTLQGLPGSVIRAYGSNIHAATMCRRAHAAASQAPPGTAWANLPEVTALAGLPDNELSPSSLDASHPDAPAPWLAGLRAGDAAFRSAARSAVRTHNAASASHASRTIHTLLARNRKQAHRAILSGAALTSFTCIRTSLGTVLHCPDDVLPELASQYARVVSPPFPLPRADDPPPWDSFSPPHHPLPFRLRTAFNSGHSLAPATTQLSDLFDRACFDRCLRQ